MISVVIPYYNNYDGLVATLMMLQMQTMLPSQIIILDSSKDKSGLALARRYRLPNVKIVVEIVGRNIYHAWNTGIELAGLDDVLIINDDLLMPIDLVEVMSAARQIVSALAYVPETPERQFRSSKVDHEFYWISKPTGIQDVNWMSGFCFMLPRYTIEKLGLFDEKYQVWYGDTDFENRILEEDVERKIIKVQGLYVYHYGSTSYGKLKSKSVTDKIAKDREYFLDKWKE